MEIRNLLVLGMLVALALGVGIAVSHSTLQPAEFSFANGADIKSVDPAIVTGHPEGNIVYAVFEGLYRNLPAHLQPGFVESPATGTESSADPGALVPQPATAESCDISENGLLYTFRIRPTARWSDGSPVTAHDFAWSWKRFLHPDVPNQYVYQLSSYVAGAEAFNREQVTEGTRVEVELPDRPRALDPFPSGTILAGILIRIQQPDPPDVETLPEEKQAEGLAAWRRLWRYEVEIKPQQNGQVDWDAAGTRRVFAKEIAGDGPVRDGGSTSRPPVERCLHVFPHFDSTVGITALDDQRLAVRLREPTSFFLELCGFYVLSPVHRPSVEQWGYPQWTKPEHLVTNGPYQIEFRRIRDRIRLRKNPHYWNAAGVHVETVDAMAIASQTTMLNMYIKGQLDWIDDPPQAVIPQLRQRDDWHGSIRFGTYFYRLNVTVPPLDNVLVRRALNQALDKRMLCENVTRAGEVPARSVVPPGVMGYVAPQCEDFDPQAAARLLAEAGYPGGQGFPRLSILYNTSESHRAIAEVIQQQWSRHLGISVDLKNREWQVYLDDTSHMNYEISRYGWIGDYADPNTFLDLFVTDGPNNNTGWGSTAYDDALQRAKSELDPARRFAILQEAEQIIVRELPVLPIYYYASKNLVNPRFQGFHENLMDVHHLQLLRRRE